MRNGLHPRRALIGLGAAGAAVVGAAAALRRVDAHALRCRGGWALVYTRSDAQGEPVRVLRQDGVYQSATYLDDRRFDPVFSYHAAFDVLFEPEVASALRAATGHTAQRVLALGGGGCAWPKHAVMTHDEVSVDVVELDPAIVRAARRWFFVDEVEERSRGRLRLITGDGRAVLEAAARAQAAPRYDAIVSDTFVGREPVRSLATVEAARLARASLVSGGFYLANVVSEAEGTDLSFLRDEVATLAQVFTRVSVIPADDEAFGGEGNYLVVATDSACDITGAIPFDEDFLGTPLSD